MQYQSPLNELVHSALVHTVCRSNCNIHQDAKATVEGRMLEGKQTASTRTLPTRTSRYTVLKSDTPNRDDDEMRCDAHMTLNSPAVGVATTAETVEHLQQAILCFETMLTESVKIMQLPNFLDVAKHVHYDIQKQTKRHFSNTIDVTCTLISVLNELTANGVTV